MNRAFTTREKILIGVLAVLVIACVYYLLVLQPSMNTLSTAGTRLSDAQDELTITTTKYAKYTQMKQAIEDAQNSGAASMKVPDYDNTKAEMTELDSILSTTEGYTVTFGEATLDGSIVRRPVSITYTATSYDNAESVLRKLLSGTYSCLVTDFTVASSASKSSSSSSGTWSASLEAVMFEKATSAAANLPAFEGGSSSSSSSSSSSTVASQISSAVLTS